MKFWICPMISGLHPGWRMEDNPGASDSSPTGRRIVAHQGIENCINSPALLLFKIEIRKSDEKAAHQELGRSLRIDSIVSRLASFNPRA